MSDQPSFSQVRYRDGGSELQKSLTEVSSKAYASEDGPNTNLVESFLQPYPAGYVGVHLRFWTWSLNWYVATVVRKEDARRMSNGWLSRSMLDLFPGGLNPEGQERAIDRTMTGLPLFGHLNGSEGIFYAFGYSGNGVGPTHLGGRVLASLTLGLDDEFTRLPLVGFRAERFPPEPFRYVGARVIRAALARREAAEDVGKKPVKLDVALASFMPGGLVPVKTKDGSS